MSIKVYSIEKNLNELGKDINDLADEIIQQAKNNIQILAAGAHSLIIEKANQKLKSRRDDYIKAVGFEQIRSSKDEEIWAVTLDKSAGWIEDGLPDRNMLDNFVNSPKAKISKEGNRYLVIPFKHNKAPSQMGLNQVRLANYVKSELNKLGLNKVIRDPSGKAVSGKVASVNLTGPNSPKSRNGKFILQGLSVYQRITQAKSGREMVRRDVMTFRIASDKQRGSGLWDYPQLPGAKIFEEVEKTLDVLWDTMIKEIIEKVQ